MTLPEIRELLEERFGPLEELERERRRAEQRAAELRAGGVA